MKKKKMEDIFQYRNVSEKEKKGIKIAGAIVLGITTVAIAIRKKGVIIKWKSSPQSQMMTMIFGLMIPF